MGHVTRLRTALADRAGALAQAATVIGLHGGNILSIDVHRTGEPSGVNDLTVEFPDEPDLSELEHDLETDARAVILEHAPAEPADPVVAALGMVGRLLSTTRADLMGALAEAASGLSGSAGAWATDEVGASGFAEGRQALDQGRPVTARTTNLPPALRQALGDIAGPGSGHELWLAAVPEPSAPDEAILSRPGSRRVVFVVRSGLSAFTATELERIDALMVLQRKLLEIFALD